MINSRVTPPVSLICGMYVCMYACASIHACVYGSAAPMSHPATTGDTQKIFYSTSRQIYDVPPRAMNMYAYMMKKNTYRHARTFFADKP